MSQLATTVIIPTSAASFEAALEGLTRLNEQLLGRYGGPGGVVPTLYESGVRYKREPRDVWRHALDVARLGVADCEDLSAWRAAELRLSGEDPDAYVRVYQSGPKKYHAIVARGDGTTEDPSKKLGMGKPKKMKNPQRAERIARAKAMAEYCREIPRTALGNNGTPWIGVGADPTPANDSISFDLYKSGRGWSGIIRIPTSAGRALFAKTSPSPSKTAAASKSVNIASKLARNPLLQSVIPPQAKLAMSVLKSPIGKAITGNVIKKLF